MNVYIISSCATAAAAGAVFVLLATCAGPHALTTHSGVIVRIQQQMNTNNKEQNDNVHKRW